MQYKILFVDDETANLRLLERLFRGQYEVISAASGSEALALMEVHDIALIISDQRMPGMTGIEFLKRAAQLRPQTVRIMLTGYTDAEALVEAINSGVVYKYIAKPWINEDLQLTAVRALQHFETLKGQRQLQMQNERLRTRLRSMRDGLVNVLSEMVDMKDPLARRHAERVRDYAVELGRRLDLSGSDLQSLATAAFVHEVVDVRIPAHILAKNGSASEMENQLIRRSFDLGVQMLEDLPELEEVVAVLKFVHERFDGSGFPNGFAAEQIPIAARIIAVADLYDSLTNPRNGEKPLTNDEAIAYLIARSGRELDPNIVRTAAERRGAFLPAASQPVPVFA